MTNISPFEETIGNYDKEIQDYLLSPNFHGHREAVNYNIIDSINKIIIKSLADAPALDEIDSIQNNSGFKNCDCVFFGDIHGQLDLFLQNLYIAGIIKKDGSLKEDNKKSIIQLGDTVDKGSFQMETLVYLRILQNEAKKNGIDFHYLAGNHELDMILKSKDSLEDKIIGKILKEDIKNGVVKLSYTHPSKNIISFHSSMEKEIFQESLLLMSEEPQYKKNLLPFKKVLQEKNSYERIYKSLSMAGISITDVSSWLNGKFKELISNDAIIKESPYFKLFASPQGFTRSKLKASNTRHHKNPRTNPRDFLVEPSELKYRYKPIQISGHKQTVFGVNGAFGTNGGIMQNKANIFADCGLVDFYGGFQAFVSLNSKKGSLFALEFIDKNKAISGLLPDKSPSLLKDKIQNIKVRQLESLKAYEKTLTSLYT